MLEALIFASPQPVAPQALAAVVELSLEEVEAAIKELAAHLADRGLRLQRHRGRLQVVSAPEAAPYIEDLLGLDVNLSLSQAALETLAIISYAQPVTRPQIESIRGVSSDSVLRTLLLAGLIEKQGRADSLGRPILYGTTFEFLQQFGLNSPDDLPPLKDKIKKEKGKEDEKCEEREESADTSDA
ncbi:MAG: SMC-Scp complex subunit ScpB [Chloroflexi bacterium]|jgi:segregation and condensation protein B|nr:SMC-Scp complex subunit ScpB [Chloroflexota bacterium]